MKKFLPELVVCVSHLVSPKLRRQNFDDSDEYEKVYLQK